jgi:hypothetical protein
MSGKKGESRATFFAAIDLANIQSNDMINEIESYLNKFIDSKDKLNVSQQKKSDNPRQDVLEADTMHKQFTKFLTDKFNNNQEFRNAFIYEAMSGKKKFGDKEGTASHVLVFDDKKGINNKLNKVDDTSFIKKKASSTKVNVS